MSARPIVYLRAGLPRLGWYADAEDACRVLARRYRVSLARVVDVLALTSPRVSVRHNVALTRAYLDGAPRPMLPATCAALAHWEATGEIRGPKTAAFAAAIRGDTRAVVLDTWMARAFDCEAEFSARDRRRMLRAVRSLAGRVNVTPRDAQEAIWIGVREAHNRASDARLTGFL